MTHRHRVDVILWIPRLLPGRLGGAEMHTLRLADALAARGRYVTVISNGARETVAAVCAHAGAIHAIHLPLPAIRMVGMALHVTLLTLALLLAPSRAVVHVVYIKPASALVVAIARFLGHRVVCRSTGEDLHDLERAGGRAPLAGLQLALLRRAHTIVAQSRAAGRVLIGLGIGSERVRVIPNGIDVRFFAPPNREPEHGPCLTARRCPTMLCVSHLREEKRLDLAIEALAIMVSHGHNVKLVVLGQGPLHADLLALAERLGVAAYTEFAGFEDNVIKRMQHADVFLLPSDRENHSNALIEAMACGLPVVATAVGGNLETITDGVDGLLVPPGSPEAMAEAVLELLDHPELAQRLGAAARETVLRGFSLESMVKAYERLYGFAPAGETDAD